MEEYHNNLRDTSGGRTNFLYSSSGVGVGVGYGRSCSGGNSSLSHHHLPIATFPLQSDNCFHQSDHSPHPTVKTEAPNSSHHHPQIFQYPLMRSNLHHTMHPQQAPGGESSNEVEAIKAKIIAHPQYSNLLQAYMDCQKVTNFLNTAYFRDYIYMCA